MVQKVICLSLSGAKVTTSDRMLDMNMEYTIPSRIIVLVEKELSSIYERLRIRIRDPNANSAARIMDPEKGSRGSRKPKAIASAAPREAPLEMPSVEPSASGFFKSPCMAAPHTERAAPPKYPNEHIVHAGIPPNNVLTP